LIDFHRHAASAIASVYSLSDVKSLVDVGGGVGNLLSVFLEANPSLRGTLFECPHVAEAAIQRLRAAGLSDRCDVLEGDFFEWVPTGGDAIHDWDEAHCLTLLGNCRRAMAPGGRLLVVEIVLPGANEPSPGKLFDLVMLTASQRGQERTAAEYQQLLGTAGSATSLPSLAPCALDA
jgi:hypothetical protein